MSEKISIKELLEGVEVEWKSLGEIILSLKTGLNPRQNFKLNTSDAEGYYVTVREIQNGKIVFSEKTDKLNTKALKIINNRSNLEVGDVLFSGTGTVGRIAVIEIQPQNWNIKEGIYVIKPIRELLNSKYLAHLLNSSFMNKEFNLKTVGSPVVSLPMGELKKIPIPIPPLHIQSEIVRILDNFTELTAELTAELRARKKQYSFYRDKLLSFEDGEVEFKSLGEVVIRTKGTPITATQMKILDKPNAPVKIFAGGKTIAYFDYADLPQKDINTFSSIIVKSRGVIEFEYYDKPFSHKNEMWSYHSEQIEINIKFIYYFLKTQEEQLRNKATSMGAFPQIAISDTEKIQIPIPPLHVQEKIVSILDKFDTLTNSISEGLPREIDLRQKQYEYYRDLLLSFPKKEVEA